MNKKNILDNKDLDLKGMKKHKKGSVKHFYVLKDDLLEFKECEDLNDLYDWYDKMMETSEELWGNCKEDRENGLDSSCGMDYSLLPAELLVRNKIENRKDYICLVLASWMFTYCKAKHTFTMLKATATFGLTNEEIIETVNEIGKSWCLEYAEYKDKFHRRKKTLKFDFEKYYELFYETEKKGDVE